MSASAWGSHLRFINIPFLLIPSCFETEVGAVAPSSGVADDMIDVIVVLQVWRYRVCAAQVWRFNFLDGRMFTACGAVKVPLELPRAEPHAR